MKQAFILLICSVASFLAAQEPQTGNYPFYKKIADVAPGLSCEYPADAATVEAALLERLNTLGATKPGKVSGDLMIHPASVLTPVSTLTLDYYTRVEEVKGDQPRARVTLFMALGNDNFLSTTSHPQETAAARSFLQSLGRDVNRYLMERATVEATATLAGQEKLIQELTRQMESLEKEKAKLEQAMKENARVMTEQQKLMQEAETRRVQLRTAVEGLRRETQQLRND